MREESQEGEDDVVEPHDAREVAVIATFRAQITALDVTWPFGSRKQDGYKQ